MDTRALPTLFSTATLGLLCLCLASPAQAAFIGAFGTVFVSGGTCAVTALPNSYDETCSNVSGTEARALATVAPAGALPALGALATLSSPLGSTGGTADAQALFEDVLGFDVGTATVTFVIDIDGTLTTAGTSGDGPSAFFSFQAPGAFVFQEFSVGFTSTTRMTGDIPVGAGTLDVEFLLKAFAGAPGGGIQNVDFSSTATIVDVIQKDRSGNRVFHPITSALGFVYGEPEASVSEPGVLLLMAMGLGAVVRRRAARP